MHNLSKHHHFFRNFLQAMELSILLCDKYRSVSSVFSIVVASLQLVWAVLER